MLYRNTQFPEYAAEQEKRDTDKESKAQDCANPAMDEVGADLIPYVLGKRSAQWAKRRQPGKRTAVRSRPLCSQKAKRLKEARVFIGYHAVQDNERMRTMVQHKSPSAQDRTDSGSENSRLSERR